jgi:phenylacetate-CoA ligase
VPVRSEEATREYERRCEEALETALGRTALYETWRRLDPGSSRPVDERYSALPALTKSDIRAHFPRGLVPNGMDLAAGLASGEVSYVRTSGTADESLTNIWNQAWWDASERGSWALNAVAARMATGTHREAILASALSVGPRSEGERLSREQRMLGRFLFLNEYAFTTEWPEGHERRILAELGEFQPEVLEANPSLIARLARFADRAGIDSYQPKLVILTYEYPSRVQLRAIRRVFSSPLASSYGSTEAGYVFMQCERGRLHQNTEFCRVDFQPLADGPGMRGVGRLLVTTFGNAWFPLLRFEIGDVGRLAPSPCPCGRSDGMTLSAVEGRLVSVCVGADGRLVTHGQIDDALGRIQGIAQYKLAQEAPGSVVLSFVAEEGRGEHSEAESEAALRDLFGSGITVSVNEVPSISPEKSGKFLLVRRMFPLELSRILRGGSGADV